MVKQYYSTGLEEIKKDITIHNIFSVVKRNAKNLYVINDGSDKMFVQTYSDKTRGVLCLTEEHWILPNRRLCFHDVYEVIISKTSIGNKYRITEFET